MFHGVQTLDATDLITLIIVCTYTGSTSTLVLSRSFFFISFRETPKPGTAPQWAQLYLQTSLGGQQLTIDAYEKICAWTINLYVPNLKMEAPCRDLPTREQPPGHSSPFLQLPSGKRGFHTIICQAHHEPPL